MASLPQKGQVGQNFKAWVVAAVNQIIDYLVAMRIRKGTGIEVQETPSGVVISLAKPQSAAPQIAAAGTAASYGLEAVVSGGTASVQLVAGGTASSIPIVATSPVTITGGTNGELVIGSTASSGGGMRPPDYDHTKTIISASSSTAPRQYDNEDVWLIGSALAYFGEYNNDTNRVVLQCGTTYTGYLLIDGSILYGNDTVPSPYDTITVGASFCYFIPAGTRFVFNITGNAYVTCEVHPTLP